MSVQFGIWNFETQQTAPDYSEKVSAILAPYGPDSNEAYSKGGVKILYRAFHTTKESRHETQPHISPSGAVITWDGRLDNRAELIRELQQSLTISSTDVAIVAAAYEKWGTDCFAKLIGDWAFSIWNPINRSLILAKDPIGTHHLYYSFEKDHVSWSTILDPLVLFAGKTLTICEEYIAGWLAIQFPAAHLTPYAGIYAVPPSSSVLLRPGNHTVSKYWDFDPDKKIRYSTDADYEEHFRSVFANAVQCRLRSDRPVLAELSGGMDSASIVCMADTFVARREADSPSLDTISWYDDSYDHLEPDTNERRFFTKVEEKRGRTGYHIALRTLKHEEISSQRSITFDFEGVRFAATPIPNRGLRVLFKEYAAFMKSRGHRVTLSGLGGETATGGGAPTPTPEVQNLLARGRLFNLTRQVNAWAVKMRKPRLPLLWQAIRGFLPLALAGVPNHVQSAPWFHQGFVRRNQAAFCGYPFRVKLFGPSPSFQHHLGRLDDERRLMAYLPLQPEILCEVRFPYLDRGLLEFMFAIPQEQIVRVGQRRSLMKRALVGIVPDEILNRKRKAPLQQEAKQESPSGSSTEWPSLAEVGPQMVSCLIGIVEPSRFLEELQKAPCNEEVLTKSLRGTLRLESWLRHVRIQGVLTDSFPTTRQHHSSNTAIKELHSATQPKGSAS
jgi:asparagine synthase (glutamine-hydrolysing)